MSNSAISALENAAGVSVGSLSMTIRTLLLALVFFWAAACIYGHLMYWRHHGIDWYDAQRAVLRILFVLSITVVLVFIA